MEIWTVMLRTSIARRRGCWRTARGAQIVGVLFLGLLVAISTEAGAKVDPLTKCRAAKLLAAAKKTLAKLKCERKGILTGTGPDSDCLAKVEAKFTAAISKAESKVSCPGTATDLETSVDSCVANLVEGVPPCAADGASVGGACWYLGSSGGCGLTGNDGCSCDDVCTAAGLAYDAATQTYAGSGGTLANCTAVLSALLGNALAPNESDQTCAVGLGCNAQGQIGERCTSPATTSSDWQLGARRACACK